MGLLDAGMNPHRTLRRIKVLTSPANDNTTIKAVKLMDDVAEKIDLVIKVLGTRPLTCEILKHLTV